MTSSYIRRLIAPVGAVRRSQSASTTVTPHRDELIGTPPDTHQVERYIFNGMFAFAKRRSEVLRPAEKTCTAERSDTDAALTQQGCPTWRQQSAWSSFIQHDRHAGRANYLFVDGHVAALRWQQTVGDGRDEQDGHHLPEFDPPRSQP